MMEIIVYIKDNDNESSKKNFELLEKCELVFASESYGQSKSNVVGEKVRKLPHVVIDGERVGSYYDLVEYLMNKNIINYTGEPRWKMKS